MAVTKTEEAWITTTDGKEIFTKKWKPANDSPVATVVFCHGFGEHINRYCHVFEKFAEAGIEVYSYDQRGFGETGKKNHDLGVTGGWRVSCSDITDALRKQRRSGIPQFLMGHSMGGGLVLHYATLGEERNNISGVIACSPWLDQPPAIRAKWYQRWMGDLGSMVMPNMTITLHVDPKGISHDPAEVKKYENDPLNTGKLAISQLMEILHCGQKIRDTDYVNLTQPLLMAHGTTDPVTCFSASKELFEKAPSTDKMFKPWDELYHELHNEYQKDEIIQSYIDWILKRVGSKN
ncbi:7127_t:CDS:2 [Paraglomus occultum]|uniref:7127_t:CDS:1 n=1 Tax=Paraglomus occultum TaxID=144539 RepID=A0A9N9FHM8_9GLOM|nr:7127_t:CDS:2 [Paraglomus occultum]